MDGFDSVSPPQRANTSARWPAGFFESRAWKLQAKGRAVVGLFVRPAELNAAV